MTATAKHHHPLPMLSSLLGLSGNYGIAATVDMECWRSMVQRKDDDADNDDGDDDADDDHTYVHVCMWCSKYVLFCH